MRCDEVEIAALDARFASQLAALHARALPADVLPALGPRFLMQYHGLALASPSQAVLGALRDGRLVGFCQLSFAPLTTLAVLKARPSALLSVLRLAVRDAGVLIRGIRMAKRPSALRGAPEIAFIAVHPDWQRKGIGKSLIAQAGRLVSDKGFIRVVTKTSNVVAKRMYEDAFHARVVCTVLSERQPYWYLVWDASQTATDVKT